MTDKKTRLTCGTHTYSGGGYSYYRDRIEALNAPVNESILAIDEASGNYTFRMKSTCSCSLQNCFQEGKLEHYLPFYPSTTP